MATFTLSLTVFAPMVRAEYEAYDVDKGGTIRGRVAVRGAASTRAALEVQKDSTVCGHEVEDRSLLVGEDGALLNAVVFLTDIEAGKPIDTEFEPTLDNRACRFEPHVQSISVGQRLMITNSDPILHNTHSYVLEGERGNRFNLALARQGTKILKPIQRPGLHQVKCDAGHTWMNAYFWSFDHPYHTVTGNDGTFELGDVPPGTYTLRIWHETLGDFKTTVEVDAGKATDLPGVVFEAPKSSN